MNFNTYKYYKLYFALFATTLHYTKQIKHSYELTANHFDKHIKTEDKYPF